MHVSRLLLGLGVMALVLFLVLPADAIQSGDLDGDGHPYVGLMVAFSGTSGDYTPMWRCSGTLISSTVFLTAGHCVESPATHVEIWFDADVESGILTNGYPFTGDVSGKPYEHPDYDTTAFYECDVGIVELDDAWVLTEYGELPVEDQLDALKTKRGLQDTTFTTVGYGLQRINPAKIQADRVRMVAYPRLIQINKKKGIPGDYAFTVSANNNTGGACFGDSGGPTFVGKSNVIAGVNSFAINKNCRGMGGVFRVDREDILEWIETFLD